MHLNSDMLMNTVHKMIRIVRTHRCICEQNIRRIGLHHSQHRILAYISRLESPPTQKELAAAFDVSPAAIAVTLTKLENGGYIRRITESCDMRHNRIALTEKGRTIVESSRAVFREMDAMTFAGFSDDELEEFNAYLERILKNLKEEENAE